MSKISLLIQKTHEQAKLPQYANPGDACFDLQWQPAPGSIPGHIARDGLELTPGQCLIFRTGLKVAFPADYVLQIFSRSGHGFKHQVSLANGTGIIDSGFRGELQVALLNHSNTSLVVFKPGDRIAQAMLVKREKVEMQEVSELPESVRGENGFGSTGVLQLPLVDMTSPLPEGFKTRDDLLQHFLAAMRYGYSSSYWKDQWKWFHSKSMVAECFDEIWKKLFDPTEKQAEKVQLFPEAEPDSADTPLETGEADALPMPPALCEDEGCPMRGIHHVCLSK